MTTPQDVLNYVMSTPENSNPNILGPMLLDLVGDSSGDATAVAADIAPTKTAYVGGVKITGTSIAIDTTPGAEEVAAAAADIVADKVAFVNGAKITGVSVAIDTTITGEEVAATAADIAVGKTAFVNGVKILGTAT